jgi:hypothetical protein
MGMKRERIGNAVRWLGWIIVGLSIVQTAYWYIDIHSDPSVRAYAPLVVIEGGFLAFGGVVVVVIGRLIRGRGAAPNPDSRKDFTA